MAICVPGMYPSGFDYMAPPPPYPGPPQNWAAPSQNWTAPPPQPPPGLFLSLPIFFFFFFLCATALVRSDLSASTWITSKHAIKKEKRGVLMSPSLQIKMSRNKTVFSPSCCCFSSNFGDFRLKTASPSVHQSVLHHLVPIDFSKFEDLRSFQLRFMWLLKHSSVHLFSLQC